MKKKANIFHHTHWDNEWYFTEEDSLIQLSYHMKELLYALEHNIIDYFYLDGQTAILEDYISLHEEDKERIQDLIRNAKLMVGPFHTQLDSFICSGESIIHNLRYGIQYANQLGGVTNVAYLPDSFGQSQDYPKIFRQFGIESFVFRRGMGDEHQLPLDFIFRSNDGSEVVSTTLHCGYGFATEPFINHTLIKDAGLDYDGKDIKKQLENLSALSTLKDEFLLPIGNDQTPVIWNFKELLAECNQSEYYEFEETTLPQYMEKLKANRASLLTYEGEFINPQYHRVHRSISSARMDIKLLQDKIERLMALEIQPMMTILQEIGLAYDEKIIQRIWNLLVRSQTHSGATNTDQTNGLILTRTQRALNLAEALKVYLIRKVAISLPSEKSPVVFFNTLPYSRTMIVEIDIYTKKKDFSLVYQHKKVSYSIMNQQRKYGGVARKDTEGYEEEKYYYQSRITLEINDVEAFSYHTLYVVEGEKEDCSIIEKTEAIENEYYRIVKTETGLRLYHKEFHTTTEDFIYIEESGDEGDNYDYSYPVEDMINVDSFAHASCCCTTCKEQAKMVMTGSLAFPSNLKKRASHVVDTENPYEIEIQLKKKDRTIGIKGFVNNHAKNHRVRIVVRTPYDTTHSLAGTQFGNIQRENNPKIMQDWKREGWLEEPSPIYPFLNYVVLAQEDKGLAIFTKASKEYEIIGKTYSDFAVTIFRSVGHLGLPDLQRRPGRASGVAEKIIPSPDSQMLGKNYFDLGLHPLSTIDTNSIVNRYNEYAVEECYYQNQTLNRVVYPISYFHTNPLYNEVEDSYVLPMNMEYKEYAFSTLECNNEKGILRLFNNMESKQTKEEHWKLDLLGNKIEKSKIVRHGEIANLQILSMDTKDI